MIDIQIGTHKFIFKPLVWSEEFETQKDRKRDWRRVVLAQALVSVGGFQIPSLAEAVRLMDNVPLAIVSRAFLLYKAGLPPAKKFSTVALYQAPEPSVYLKRTLEEEGSGVDDPAINRAIEKFGKEEVEEDRKMQHKMFEAAKKRGTVHRVKDEKVVKG